MLRFIKWLIKTIISLILVAVLLVVGVNFFVMFSGSRTFVDEIDQLNKSSYVMVLGASVKPDKTPSDVLKERLDTGIEIYKAGKADKILMTGDNGSVYYDEVGVMKTYALGQGVPAADIEIDKLGFSTYDSIYRAKEVLGINDMIVVTQKYHLYRAAYIAKSFDINVQGYKADDGAAGSSYFEKEVRELLARDKDFVMCLFKPEPGSLMTIDQLAGDLENKLP